MKKTRFFIAALMLCVALAAAGCTAQEKAPAPQDKESAPAEESTTQPEDASKDSEAEASKDSEANAAKEAEAPGEEGSASMMQWGTVKEIIEEDGKKTALLIESDANGECIINLSDETVWVDGGKRIEADPAALKAGDGVYVFHSEAVTLSLPPQTSAYAIVSSLPQDAKSPIYMTVDSIDQQGEELNISANQGEYELLVNKDTTYSPYKTKNMVGAADIKEGSRLMVWYATDPGLSPNSVDHIMILPDVK